MDQLPYELLQHISQYLLPRYQCRLALASKYNYHHLYNDLLKWHAKKSLISVPQYNIYSKKRDTISVLVTPADCPRVLLFETVYGNYDDEIIYCESLTISDVTNSLITEFWLSAEKYEYYKNVLILGDTCNTVHRYRKFNIFTGKYRYIHKNILLQYINIQQPIYSLKSEILTYMFMFLGCDAFNLYDAIRY